MTYAVCAKKCPKQGEPIDFLANELIDTVNKFNYSIYDTDTSVVSNICTPPVNSDHLKTALANIY